MANRSNKPVPTTTDALDVAMELAGDEDAARTLLAKHGRLIDAQIKSEQLEHGAKRMQVALRVFIAIAATAIAVALLGMVINAKRDHGLVVEALSVPPDLAQRGETGEALAANLADRLAEIDRQATSWRSAETLATNWGKDISFQIPQTGVSIGELDRMLHRKLGHQTVVGGAVFRSPEGLRLTVRAGDSGTVEQTGTDATLEAMVQKAAEGVFEKTQPYRYSKYLEFAGRRDEAMKVARTLAESSDDPKERAWAWGQITNLLIRDDTRGGVAAGRRAIAEDPDNPLALINLAIVLAHLSHGGEAAAVQAKANVLGSQANSGLSEIGLNNSRANLATAPADEGDFAEMLRQISKLEGRNYPGMKQLIAANRAGALIAMHDVSGARRVADLRPDTYFATILEQSGGLNQPDYDAAIVLGDYREAVARARDTLAVIDKQPESPEMTRIGRERHLLPSLAIALALGGRLPEAASIAAALPHDCFNCKQARMIVAGVSGDLPLASRLERELVAEVPRPFTPTAMSQIYFRAGRYADALAAADRAVKAGPHYADAHKARGDALRRRGRIDEALDEYATAEKTAPRWGRLQIDWALAAWRKGDRAGARDHLRKAATMDLGSIDRAVLVGLRQVAGA